MRFVAAVETEMEETDPVGTSAPERRSGEFGGLMVVVQWTVVPTAFGPLLAGFGNFVGDP
jgi:hypothetical protein